MSTPLYTSLAILACATLYSTIRRTRADRENLPLPPGPKKLPLIGNLLDAPSEFQWIKYHEWAKHYDSDIIHLNIAGSSLIVIDTAEAANELFDKRSSIYSSRPRFIMLNELMGWSWLFATMEYGELWKQHRKLFQREFHPNAVTALFQPQVLKHTSGLLTRLLESPDDFMEHINQKAKVWKHYAEKMVRDPFAVVKERMAGGTYEPSFTSRCLENVDDTGDIAQQERLIQGTAANLYAAGFDTTTSALNSLILALLTHPDVQARAWREIDSVLGGKRLPDFEDMDSLPYVTAITREVQSFYQAIPHFVTVEDEYKGYRIPANSIVVGNAWAMLHDETKYPDPFAFKPERWLLPDGKFNPDMKEPTVAFGFGRRLCPGRHLASASIWITAALLLSVFECNYAVDEDGKTIVPSGEYCPGLIP
ncbi:hypothetical protein EYR36_010741 [Pleurotus pulmonarius]|nr:hypothetical protein EYR36_010741 [Pleurotus pulmonarius]